MGEWELVDLDMGMEIPEEQKEMFESAIEEMKEKTVYTFTDDGKITMRTSVMGEAMSQEGTYSVKGNILTVIFEGESSDQEIDLTDETLSFQESANGVTMSMTFERK